MGYVLAEIALLLALALLLGLLVGWLLWGWRRANVSETKYLELLTERDELRRSYVNRASGASPGAQSPATGPAVTEPAAAAQPKPTVSAAAAAPIPAAPEPDIDLTQPPEPAAVAQQPSPHESSTDLDDLTAIDGIDAGFADFLKTNNISTYRELGSLTEDEIDELQTRLPGNPKRIRDDDWVGGARRLYNDKYGQLRANDQ